MKTVIFTGAGAGKADGAPLQTELFQEFFGLTATSDSHRQLTDDVAGFFQRVFSVDPRLSPIPSLPTFEEALGVVELAVLREEGILRVGKRGAVGDLRHLRRQLILALAVTIARKHRSGGTEHGRLITSLREEGLLENVTFVTTNYDTLLDDAIETEAIVVRGTGSVIDYGLTSLVAVDKSAYLEHRKFPCYKLHGSLNWLFCPACDVLSITYASTGVMRLLDEPAAAQCPRCETLRTPIIVPPSYYKDISNVHLAVVWNRAFRAIQDADRIIFCGYSFPDADMHVKYVVKRAQLNRDPRSQPLSVALVNNHDNKNPKTADDELARFSRFIGAAHVMNTGLSFQQFAQDPRTAMASLMK